MNAAVQEALDSIGHRERWKYSKPQRAIDLVVENADASLLTDQARAQTPLQEALGLDTLLSDAPETLAGFGLNQSIDRLECTADQTVTLHATMRARPLLIDVAANASLTLRIETSETPSRQATSHLWIRIAEGARVNCVRNFIGDAEQWHLLHASLARDAKLSLNSHSTGSAFHRQDTRIALDGPGAELDLAAATVCPPKSHFDSQLVVEHRAGQSQSRQKVHVVAREDAEATFGGRIHIHEQCPGVDADLSNRNLVLSPTATINAKPELEIYTDDVSCAHGATIGRLDDDQAFYCESRGIDALTARRLLCFAFLKSAMADDERALHAFERWLK